MDHLTMNHGMKMYFHFGFGDQFMFQNLTIDSSIKLWSVCAVLFVLSILYESIKYYRCVRCGCQPSRANCPADSSDLQDNGTHVKLAHNCYVGRLRSKRYRLIQTVLHTIQTTLGFILMLSVMSFNVCIIFAVIAGTAAGYYIFYRPYNEIEAIDSCH